MIAPIKQKQLHDPDNGLHGDCWAACIASITGLPLDEIPNPNEDRCKEWSQYWVIMWEYLQEKGFNLYCESIPKFKDNEQSVIACGKSPRGDWHHAVVWNNGIIHDPHPEDTGIHSITHFEVIERI